LEHAFLTRIFMSLVSINSAQTGKNALERFETISKWLFFAFNRLVIAGSEQRSNRLSGSEKCIKEHVEPTKPAMDNHPKYRFIGVEG
jgi:hypothetical protein